jgi:retron-type reverse transcriptase
MSLIDWIKSIFGAAPKRDISRLSPASGHGGTAELDATEELVDVSGGPLKENHLRRALRDKRLLPKIKSPARQLGVTKRKKIMSVTEAERLFGGTMRARNRNLRDLVTDEQQLERYGLPAWKTEEDVAQALGISLKELWFFGIHREREQQPHYVTFSIPKRTGGKRLIMAPKRRLKAMQRKLLALLVEKLPVHENAHAFRRGRNVRTGAAPHVGKGIVLRLDLKDFFPSVTFARVRGLLIAYGYGFPVATTLAVLMTEAERQPVAVDDKVYHVPVGLRHCAQGAPTSPGLCNVITLRLDRRLSGLAKKHGFAFTRYADDLTFSGHAGPAAAQKLRIAATRIITEEGFTLNAGKTRAATQSSRQIVTGVVVNKDLGLSRQERRRLRAMAHRLRQQHAAGTAPPEELAKFRGRLAYLRMLNPEQATRIGTVP